MDVAAHETDVLIARGPYEPDGDEDFGSPYDGLARELISQRQYLERIANATEKQRTSPRPTQVLLNTATPYGVSLQLRTETLVLTCSAACVIGLQIGSGVVQNFNFAGADTRVIPFVTMISPGVDLILTTTAGTVTGYLIAYTD